MSYAPNDNDGFGDIINFAFRAGILAIVVAAPTAIVTAIQSVFAGILVGFAMSVGLLYMLEFHTGEDE